MKIKLLVLSTIVLIAILMSCNKSTTFGSDLLDDLSSETIYTDTVTFRMSTVAEDSVYTSDPNSTADYLICGNIADPILGTATADIYTGIQLSSFNANFKDAEIDSVILYLGVDPNGVYGDTTVPMQFEITKLAEHPAKDKRFYSNQTLPVLTGAGDVIGTGSYLPRPNVGQPIIDTASTTRDSAFGAYFKIPIDTAFGAQILALDSATLNNDTLFRAAFKGLRIRSTNPGALIGLDLNTRIFSRITLYYTRQDTLHENFNVQFIGENKFVHFEKQPSSFITDRVGQEKIDDYLVLQGLAGYKIKVEVPYLDELKDWAINQADLVVYAADIMGDDSLKYTPARQLVVTKSQGDTVNVLNSDINWSLNSTDGSYALFGGVPVKITQNGEKWTRYKLSIPDHLQDMIFKQEKSTFFVNLFPQVRSGERIILHSPGTLPKSAKLQIRYTKFR